jgi:hypothetical protein
MARLRHIARKSVIPFLPSRLAERPLRRTVSGQSSHLERLHHRLREEQERQRQQREHQGSSSPPEQEVESVRRCSSVPQLEAPPAPPRDASAVGGATGGGPGGDPDDDDDSDHSTESSEPQEAEGWVARPITRDATRGCHFHDALDTLLRQAFDRQTWSIEYRCVVYQHSRGRYPDRWEATCLVRRPEDDLRGAEAFQSIIPSPRGTLQRRLCRTQHGVHSPSTVPYSVGWPTVLTLGTTPAVLLVAQRVWLSHLLVRITLG